MHINYYLGTLLLILLFSHQVFADRPEPSKTKATQSEAQPSNTETEAKEKNQKPSDIFNYQPSEKIRVDSAVTFPVDI